MSNELKVVSKKSKKTDKIDKFVMLEEMTEEMSASLDNLSKIIDEQQLLVDVVTKSEHVKKFDDFVKNVQTQTMNLVEQKKTLTNRLNILCDVINIAKENSEVKSAICKMMDGLGLFN